MGAYDVYHSAQAIPSMLRGSQSTSCRQNYVNERIGLCHVDALTYAQLAEIRDWQVTGMGLTVDILLPLLCLDRSRHLGYQWSIGRLPFDTSTVYTVSLGFSEVIRA